MTLDTFVAILAILVAIYALVPQSRILGFQYRIYKIDIAYLLVMVFSINILIILGYGEFAYFLLIYTVFCFYFIYKNSEFDLNKLPKFQELVTEFYRENKFRELIILLEQHFETLENYGLFQLGWESENYKVMGKILNIIQREEIVQEICINNVELGMKFVDVNKKWDFPTLFFQTLLISQNSDLQIEINDYLQYGRIDDSAIILKYLFDDAQKAESLSVWKPIGDQVIRLLDNQYKELEKDIYNYGPEDYLELQIERDPIYLGIGFFSVMVESALSQEITWHMWLYYYNFFTGRIIKNYNPHPIFSEPESEWLTKYDYLLYMMIRNLCGWVIKASEIEELQENTTLRHKDIYHENGNIPKSSIITLCFCLEKIIKSGKFYETQISNFLNQVFRLYFTLRNNENFVDYSEVLALSLSKNDMVDTGQQRYFANQILHYFDNYFDKIPYHEHPGQVEEFRDYFL